jgi:hypothetical protein
MYLLHHKLNDCCGLLNKIDFLVKQALFNNFNAQ